jgi:hypothetical protein
MDGVFTVTPQYRLRFIEKHFSGCYMRIATDLAKILGALCNRAVANACKKDEKYLGLE